MKQKSEKLSFFKRMYLAITDFRIYPFVQREKTSVAVCYFTLLILIITLFLSMYFTNNLFDGVSNILYRYNEKIPEFVFENGILNIEDKTYNLDGETKFVLDTSYGVEEYIYAEEAEEVLCATNSIIINKDGVIYTKGGATIAYIFPSLSEKITQNTLYSYLLTIQENWTIRVAIFLMSWLVIFVIYFVLKFLNLMFLIFIAYVLNVVFGTKLKFGNYMKIVTYAITLPLIIELVSILVLGRIPEYATFAYQLLIYVYIFYALRAIKLDVLLMGASGKNVQEKIENIISKLENEVENKLQNEKNKIDKDENNTENQENLKDTNECDEAMQKEETEEKKDEK